MYCSKDFKTIALNALSGKWFIAVAVGFAAVLLGGAVGFGPGVKINAGDSNIEVLIVYFGEAISSKSIELNPASAVFLRFFSSISLLITVLYFILGSFIRVGYTRFNLDLIDGKELKFKSIFEYGSYWKTTAVTALKRYIYIILWMLLLIIPGIIAGYSYAMTDYILAENPKIKSSEAIEMSKRMMYGNRWRFFCLDLSFLGWDILSILTFGIGGLWLVPYKQAASAAFFREIFNEGDISADVNTIDVEYKVFYDDENVN